MDILEAFILHMFYVLLSHHHILWILWYDHWTLDGFQAWRFWIFSYLRILYIFFIWIFFIHGVIYLHIKSLEIQKGIVHIIENRSIVVAIILIHVGLEVNMLLTIVQWWLFGLIIFHKCFLPCMLFITPYLWLGNAPCVINSLFMDQYVSARLQHLLDTKIDNSMQLWAQQLTTRGVIKPSKLGGIMGEISVFGAWDYFSHIIRSTLAQLLSFIIDILQDQHHSPRKRI